MRAARILTGEFTGWHMLALVLVFFGVVVGVNVFMAVSSFRSWTGLVVENSYVASQHFNEHLAASRAQAALGWQAALSSREGRVVFHLLDDTGQPVRAETVTGAFTKPIGVTQDRVLSFSRNADGTYETAEALPGGVWNIIITADLPGRTSYEYRVRYIAPEPGT